MPIAIASPTKKKKMKELAKQELMTLEALYPTKFQCLKVQLKEFIHLLDQQDQQQQQSFKQQQQIHLSILTQESSSRKREREWEKDDGYSKRRRSRKKEGISGAMQKAEACLQKIQTLKSFFGSSNDH